MKNDWQGRQTGQINDPRRRLPACKFTREEMLHEGGSDQKRHKNLLRGSDICMGTTI